MKIINEIELSYYKFDKTAVGLGFFDGIHLGHKKLIDTLVSISKEKKIKSAVFTFEDIPDNIRSKRIINKRITDNEEKAGIIRDSGVDLLIFKKFNEEFLKTSPEKFIKDILIEKLKAKVIIAGFNYHFGYKGSGDINLLNKLCEKYEIEVNIIEPVLFENKIISSSLIKEYIKKGDVKTAGMLLGRHFNIKGNVTGGRKAGTDLGFPTANIIPDKKLILPKNGVYQTITCINGKKHESITNIGTRPTFKLKDIIIETNIKGLNEDLYNKEIRIEFIKKIRDEIKFKNAFDLKQQVRKDMQNVFSGE